MISGFGRREQTLTDLPADDDDDPDVTKCPELWVASETVSVEIDDVINKHCFLMLREVFKRMMISFHGDGRSDPLELMASADVGENNDAPFHAMFPADQMLTEMLTCVDRNEDEVLAWATWFERAAKELREAVEKTTPPA